MTVRVLEGHVIDVLRTLEPESVHCIWTSVPYWGLRAYGTEPQIWGGDGACEHDWSDATIIDTRHLPEANPSPKQSTHAGSLNRGVKHGAMCQRCGVWRGEHGLEPTLEMWLANEVTIWRELRRVLRKDGCAWLNCGDAYATSPNGRSAAETKVAGNDDRTFRDKPVDTSSGGLKSKQRLMLPARLALALQADGWWLRDEIIWFKLNPMPSSVQDRTTLAHEMLYLLTKSARYYYDNVAIMEPMAESSVQRLSQPLIDEQKSGIKQDQYEAAGLNGRSGSRRPNEIVQSLARKRKRGVPPRHAQYESSDQSGLDTVGRGAGRNKRSVWPLATEPYPNAHFATAPTELVKPCILAGTSEKGCCSKCGAPWVRAVDKKLVATAAVSWGSQVDGRDGDGNIGSDQGSNHQRDGHVPGLATSAITLGWRPGCACDAPVVPCVVCDPFSGSGTTLLVADRLRRNAIGIELQPDYARQARARIKADSPLFVDLA